MQNKLIADHPFRLKRPKVITEREHSVLKLIAEGYSSSQIASRLFLSYETIRSHRKNMMRKLEVTNTASLITIGFRTGLLNTYS